MADMNNKDIENKEVNINPDDFDFGEKKSDKIVLSKNVIKYGLAAIFFVLFVINGILMQLEVQYEQFPHLAFEYVDNVPVIIQIILMGGALYAVSVVANFFGGKDEKEYHVKEDTKIKK